MRQCGGDGGKNLTRCINSEAMMRKRVGKKTKVNMSVLRAWQRQIGTR